MISARVECNAKLLINSSRELTYIYTYNENNQLDYDNDMLNMRVL